MTKEFNLIHFQDELIGKLGQIEANGVGAHKSRSRGLVKRNARLKLEGIGYSGREAMAIIDQAQDVYRLQELAVVDAD